MRNRNKDPRRIKPRRFRCPVCGVTVDMPKFRKRTEPGHIKTAWCYVCREIRDFVQVNENISPEEGEGHEAEQNEQTETAQNG